MVVVTQRENYARVRKGQTDGAKKELWSQNSVHVLHSHLNIKNSRHTFTNWCALLNPSYTQGTSQNRVHHKIKCSPRSLASKRPTWGMPMRGQWTRGGCRQCVRHRGFRQKHVWSRRHSECAEPTSRFRWWDRWCWRSRCPSRPRSRSGLQRSRGWMRQVIRGHLKLKQNTKIITTAVLK